MHHPQTSAAHDTCMALDVIKTLSKDRNEESFNMFWEMVLTKNLRGEWPSGPASSINFTEVKDGCVRSKNGMGDLPDEQPKQIIPPSFGRDVKLGVPCLDAACIVGLN